MDGKQKEEERGKKMKETDSGRIEAEKEKRCF
jgi:hypothetical protein